VVDRNINYTNVCYAGCLFCAFYRYESDEDAYVLTASSVMTQRYEAKLEVLRAEHQRRWGAFEFEYD